MLKILWERGEIAPEEQFLLLSTIFSYLMLDFHVKKRISLSLRDKRLFEIPEVAITRADCILKLTREREGPVFLVESIFLLLFFSVIAKSTGGVCTNLLIMKLTKWPFLEKRTRGVVGGYRHLNCSLTRPATGEEANCQPRFDSYCACNLLQKYQYYSFILTVKLFDNKENIYKILLFIYLFYLCTFIFFSFRKTRLPNIPFDIC